MRFFIFSPLSKLVLTQSYPFKSSNFFITKGPRADAREPFVIFQVFAWVRKIPQNAGQYSAAFLPKKRVCSLEKTS